MRVFANGVLVVLVTLSAAATAQQQPDEEKQRVVKNRDACILETKVEPDLIDRADKGDFVNDENLKCFTKCFYQKAGFVTESGVLLLDAIKAKIPAEVDKEKALKIIEKCQQTGKDACETVYLVHKCYFEHTHGTKTKESEIVEKKADTVKKATEGKEVKESESKSEKKNRK